MRSSRWRVRAARILEDRPGRRLRLLDRHCTSALLPGPAVRPTPALRPLARSSAALGMTALGMPCPRLDMSFQRRKVLSPLFGPSGKKACKISSVEEVARPKRFELLTPRFVV